VSRKVDLSALHVVTGQVYNIAIMFNFFVWVKDAVRALPQS